MISQMQENEQAYENLIQRENQLKREMDKKYVT